jgi:hypothetical protein
MEQNSPPKTPYPTSRALLDQQVAEQYLDEVVKHHIQQAEGAGALLKALRSLAPEERVKADAHLRRLLDR